MVSGSLGNLTFPGRASPATKQSWKGTGSAPSGEKGTRPSSLTHCPCPEALCRPPACTAGAPRLLPLLSHAAFRSFHSLNSVGQRQHTQPVLHFLKSLTSTIEVALRYKALHFSLQGKFQLRHLRSAKNFWKGNCGIICSEGSQNKAVPV